MDFQLTEEQEEIKKQVRALCSRFPDEYWRERDESGEFPWEFYKAIADGGWLGITIPKEYGGSGLGITEAALVMQTVAECGGGTQACSSIHLGIFGLEPLIKYGTDAMKEKYLPQILSGELHVSFAVTEPDAGTNTTQITTFATRQGDGYMINGRKVFITKAREAKKMLLLTRTTPYEQVQKKTMGMSLFFADVDPQAVEIRELHKCGRKAVDTNMLFIDSLYASKEDLIGEEGRGFYYILDGINPERVLIASEAIGMGKRAVEKAVQYAKERIVFNRPIGMNQGIQFPLAESYAKLETAELMVYKAAWLYDQGKACGKEANIAKYMAADAAYEAADRAVQAHGGYGYMKDYDVERYWREVRLFRIAPISQEMVLNYVGEHVLGLPRSY
jgi:acyl-CoA dehydrogenase